ncbi:MAG: FAD-dependent oxidoreductase [Bacteroidetes bacterium HGW-Bacteroidetes-6]|jgi:heterodisulfide reductase subunit A|nr:MAG: FAD-dependent oxidoreductase [Bacteroidetes bacterium HGW-Bacteroidetes-6]
MNKKVVVIGGGPAGMESATYLSDIGFEVSLIEKDVQTGGKLNSWDRLFPNMRLGKEVKDFLQNGNTLSKVNIFTETEVESFERSGTQMKLCISDGKILDADAVVIATGFDVFDARKKEEYGYGIYDNVITSKDLEQWFCEGRNIVRHDGKPVKRVGIVHCVGSRDEKAGNVYCSKVCCVTGVKQAIEIKKVLPEAEVFCFYMDLRMFGMHFEEMYKEAQEKHGVQFIRGRLSEASENADNSVVVKVEDTLTGRPLKMSVDLLILLVGFEPSAGTRKMGQMFGVTFNDNGFLHSADEHTGTGTTSVPGVFMAGSCSAPRTITNSILDARSTALRVAGYLKNSNVENR